MRSHLVCSPIRPALLILLLALTVPGLAAASEVIHEGGFDAKTLVWTSDTDGFAVPRVDGTRAVALPGQLDLPARDLLLLVPADRSVVAVEIEPLASHRIRRDGPLATAGLATIEGVEVAAPAVAPVDPGSWGGLQGSHLWRGYRLVTVRVRPVRPATDDPDAMEFLDAYAVRVEYGPVPVGEDMAVRQRRVPGERAGNEEMLRAVVSNAEVIRGYARQDGRDVQPTEKAFVPTQVPSLSGSAVNYLIITDENMAGEFQRLADHKTSLGLPAVVVTREFIAANYRQGVDLQETMRMFIRDAYEMWGVEFVLLGGDSDILPPRYVNNTLYPPGDSTDIPVDLYFAGLDGNWNANGNHIFGQPASTNVEDDQADFLEEVYVGRAPVSTVAHAATFVDKVIFYEGATSADSWTNNIMFAAEVLFPADYPADPDIDMDGADFAHEQITTSIEPCTTMDVLRMYETFERNPGDVILTRAGFRDSLDTGRYGIVNHIGHGYYYTASVGDQGFGTGDADGLRNGPENAFMIYALNCASAGFHYSCLMERLIQNPDGGASMAIGSVEAAFPVTSNNYQQEFFAQLYCLSEPRAGKLVALSRFPFIGNTDANYTDRWTFENYTLLGDPSMPLWTSLPHPLTVTAPAGLGLGPQAVAVTVEDAGGPVEGAIVTLTKGGEDFVIGTTDLAGQVSLDFQPVMTGSARLVVSGRNLEQTVVDLPVTAGSSYLAVTTVTVVDDGSLGSSGNGNGVLEAGETVALSTVVSETGGAGTTGLSGILTSSTPGVAVLNGATGYPDIGAGGTAAATGPYLVQLDPTMPDGTPIECEFYVNAAAGLFQSAWQDLVLAPELEIVGLDWTDDTYGNGDGQIDYSERIEISFRAKNFGAGRADAVTAYLRTVNGNVVLFDTLAVVAPLELMDEGVGSNPLSLMLLNATRRSESTIVLEDNYGRSWSHDFYPHRSFAPGAVSTDASGGVDRISLSWELSTSTDVVGYNVYRAPNAGGPFVRVNPDPLIGTAYYEDTGLAQLTMYFYQVEALTEGLVPSDPTLIVSQSTQPPEVAAFPISFKSETSGHLAVGDVDGQGGFEIVLGADEVYVWHHDGSELMDGDGDSQSNGPMTNEASVFGPSGIVLGHLDAEAGQEIVACESGNGNALVHVYRKDGTELPGWPKSTAGQPGQDWNWATPAVGDIDGDGDNEVIVHTRNGRMWAWHHDGTEVRDGDNNAGTDGIFYLRPGSNFEYAMSGPALYDLDGDGALDVIFGTRTDDTGLRRLMAIKYDGSDVPGFPVTVLGPVLCHPAVGDLNDDGVAEIVFNTTSGRIYVIQEDGSNYPGFPVIPSGVAFNVNWTSSPALGNLDGDPDLELVFACNTNGDTSHLIAIDTDVSGGTSGDTMFGWPVELPGSSEGSPVLGDIDGDGSVDILHGIGGGSTVAPNNLYAFGSQGTMVDGFPIALNGPLMASAVITDIDGDTDVDILMGSWDRLLHVWDMPFDYDRDNCPWPTFQGDFQRTGVFFPLELVDVGVPGELPPAGFLVDSPYPNPFNPQTSVRLYMPADGDLRLEVYDVQGRKVRVVHSGHLPEGWHTMTWDGRDDGGRAQASGLYFMRALSEQDVSVQKMTLLK